MSKIGKQIIKIPAELEVVLGDTIKIKSSKAELNFPILENIEANYDSEKRELRFTAKSDDKQSRSNWGTQTSIVKNGVEGLTKGFEKTLLLEGVGYKVIKEGEDLVLSLGFSHPVRFKGRAGILFEVEKNTILKIKGFNKEVVGQVAAEIRALKKPEPYKGKGFRYSDEVIIRKAGKKAATTAGGAA
ncbi:MAG: 50S ribosomal protein L6 [Patescibacteria group bacterium]